jgi:hypothetical protein
MGPENGASDSVCQGRSRQSSAGARGRLPPAPCSPGVQRPSHFRPFSPVTGPGEGETTPRTWALKTAPATAYARDARGKAVQGLGATHPGPLLPGRPASQPFSAVFARDRSRGGGNYTPGMGPENGASPRVCHDPLSVLTRQPCS